MALGITGELMGIRLRESWNENNGNLLAIVAIATTIVACGLWHFELLPEIEFEPATVIGDDDVSVVEPSGTSRQSESEILDSEIVSSESELVPPNVVKQTGGSPATPAPSGTE